MSRGFDRFADVLSPSNQLQCDGFRAAAENTANDIDQLVGGMPLVFQPGKLIGLNVTYHFTFIGAEDRKATIVIHNKKISVEEGHVGEPDLRVTADTKTWLGFLAKEKNLVWALLRRKFRLKGSPKLLIVFGKCFPS